MSGFIASQNGIDFHKQSRLLVNHKRSMKSLTQKLDNHKGLLNLNISLNLPVTKLLLSFLDLVVKEGL